MYCDQIWDWVNFILAAGGLLMAIVATVIAVVSIRGWSVIRNSAIKAAKEEMSKNQEQRISEIAREQAFDVMLSATFNREELNKRIDEYYSNRYPQNPY